MYGIEWEHIYTNHRGLVPHVENCGPPIRDSHKDSVETLCALMNLVWDKYRFRVVRVHKDSVSGLYKVYRGATP